MGNITLKAGDVVKSGQVLTTIAQNDFFDLQIPIPISRANQLRSGLPVQLLDPNSNHQLATGTIYFVSSTTDTNAQSVLTRARFSNATGKLRNSQNVRAKVIWNSKPGLLVPTLAVTAIGAQNFVFVAEEQNADGKAQMVARQVPVTLGNIQGQNYQVVSGLKPGDRVVVGGVLKLKDGTPVAPQTAESLNSTSSSLHLNTKRQPL